ncbi:MAG: Crp/Fnr family transcriptional regulator [Clostridia bacterium]|nr:Crp/Fnr family transcriptional regulator [Clostridia bacterium]
MVREEDVRAVFPLFDKMTKRASETLKAEAVKESFAASTYLSFETGVAFFWVKSGGVNVYLTAENGEQTFLMRIGKEGACVTNDSLSYKFSSRTEIVALTESGFNAMYSSQTFVSFVVNVMKEQEERILSVLNGIQYRSVEERLADFLLKASTRSKTHTVNYTQEEIAQFIGTSREVVTREIKSFVQEDLVISSRGKVSVKNAALLRKKAGTRAK